MISPCPSVIFFLISTANPCAFFRGFGLSVQGLQDSCSIHLSLLLNVTSPALSLPASPLPVAQKPPLQTWAHYVPCLVVSSFWCVQTRMPLSFLCPAARPHSQAQTLSSCVINWYPEKWQRAKKKKEIRVIDTICGTLETLDEQI